MGNDVAPRANARLMRIAPLLCDGGPRQIKGDSRKPIAAALRGVLDAQYG